MKNQISERITQLRREKKLSQKEAAAFLGISQSLLSHYENGIRECGLEFLIKIAGYYGVTCDYLLGRSQSRSGIPEDDTPLGLHSGIVSDPTIINSVHEIIKTVKNKNNIQSGEVMDYIVMLVYRMAAISGAGDFKLTGQAARSYSKGLIEYYESRLSHSAEEPGRQPQGAPVSSLGTLIGIAEKKILENMREVVRTAG